MIPGEPIDSQPDFDENGIDRGDSVILAQHLEPGPIESEVPAALVAQDDAVQDTMEEYVASEEQGGWEDSALEGLDDFDRSSLSLLPAVASPLVDHIPLVEISAVVQRDSTVAMASDQSGTFGKESYPDEEYYGPVVDQLPPPFRAYINTISI